MKMRVLFLVAVALTALTVAVDAETIDPAQAIAQKFSEANDEKPAPPKRSFARPGDDYEADMLARARAEELERHQQATALTEQKPVTDPAPIQAAAMPAPAAVPVSAPAPAPEPPAKLAALPPKPAPEPPPISRSEYREPTTAVATVLLVLDPDGIGLGIKPDPIICIQDDCWISNGISSPAHRMPRSQAVALAGTNNLGMDSCSGKSGCVFRNVRVDPTTRINVIEVGEGGGASIGAYTIAADRSCRKQDSSLVCNDGLATQNFRIWVVPEITAASAGASSLENAVAEGLPDSDVTSSNDK